MGRLCPLGCGLGVDTVRQTVDIWQLAGTPSPNGEPPHAASEIASGAACSCRESHRDGRIGDRRAANPSVNVGLVDLLADKELGKL